MVLATTAGTMEMMQSKIVVPYEMYVGLVNVRWNTNYISYLSLLIKINTFKFRFIKVAVCTTCIITVL